MSIGENNLTNGLIANVIGDRGMKNTGNMDLLNVNALEKLSSSLVSNNSKSSKNQERKKISSNSNNNNYLSILN